MELPFELSFGHIAGEMYWWWCELMGEFIGCHLGVYVDLVGEPDALVLASCAVVYRLCP